MWKIIGILHNLTLRDSWDTEFISFAPRSDTRVEEYLKRFPTARFLADNFFDEFKRKTEVSFILRKTGEPSLPEEKTGEAIVSLRNILAICSITYGWPSKLAGNDLPLALYSDYFDIYPIYLGQNNETLVSNSPALEDINQINDFCGQTTPALPSIDLENLDTYVYDPILNLWKQEYIQQESGGQKAQALFRSLEVAYLACSMPHENLSSIYDFGSRISLWVSALEILAHPGRRGKVNIGKVLTLIGKANYYSRRVSRKRYKIMQSKTKHFGNIAQKLYRELYDARNDFLHGNRVTLRRVYPFKNQKNTSLTVLAPLIYRIALVGYLSQFDNQLVDNDPEGNIEDYCTQRNIEDVLESVKRN